MSEPLVVLAQFADGRAAVSVDRDGEGRINLLCSREDAAKLIERLPDYAAGMYLTFVSPSDVQPKRKRKGDA